MAEKRFEILDEYFDEYPNDPFIPPNNGVIPSSLRRVVGFDGDRVVSITDLPPVTVHISTTIATWASQTFIYVGDWIEWVMQTLRRTRFADADLAPEDRLAVAIGAVGTGMSWDGDNGGIEIMSPPGTRHGGEEIVTRYHLRITGFESTDWELVNRDTDERIAGASDAASGILATELFDVVELGDPWTIETIVRTPSPSAQ
jgi:hypothetical protein